MNYSKDFFRASDGLKLATHQWKPKGDSSYLLTIIHGIGEHGKRYDELATFFANKGCTVVAVDLRGHGESEGKRGHTISFEQVLEDINIFVNASAKTHPNLKQVLYGHSLGGNFLLNFLLTHETSACAAVASAPALKTSFTPPPMKVFVGKLLRSIYPSLTMSNGLDGSKLSKASKTEGEYKKDPLVHNQISIEMALSSIEKGVWALENACRIALPLLVMHGTGDRITDPNASAAFIKEVDNDLGRLKLYDGLYHELHNEDTSSEILEDVFSWMQEVCD
jgi:acylglycerol lipase